MSYSLPFKYYSLHTVTFITASTFITWGSYFVYDIPGELFYPLQKWFGAEYDDSKNLALYSAYSWPTVLLSFFGGYIIDRLSVRRGSLLFIFFVICGQLLFTFGVSKKMFYLCILGRIILGCGSEALVVAQNVYVYRWFGEGPGLALIFGLLTLIRASSAVGFLFLPSLAEEREGEEGGGVVFVVWIGTFVCGVCVLLCVVTSVLDKYGEYILIQRKKDSAIDNNSYMKSMESNFATSVTASGRRLSIQNTVGGGTSGATHISLKQIKEFPFKFWIFLLLVSLLLNSFWNFTQVASDVIQNIGPYANLFDQLPARDVFAQCADFSGDFPSYYFLNTNSSLECEEMCASLDTCSGYQYFLLSSSSSSSLLLTNGTDENCYLFTTTNRKMDKQNISYTKQAGGIHPVRYGNEVETENVMCFKRSHQFSPSTASMYAGVPNFVSIISPLCGMFVDRYGRALYILILASIMLITTYIGILSNALQWTFISPLFLMIWAGFGLTFALSVAELTIGVIISPRLLGTAYGCYASLINLFSALFALLVGAVQDSQTGDITEYTFPMYIFISMAALACGLSVFVLYLDKKSNNGFSRMNASVAERIAREEGEMFLMKASCDEIF